MLMSMTKRYTRKEASPAVRTTSLLLLVLVIAAESEAQSPQVPNPSAAPLPPSAFANLHVPGWLRVGVEHRGRLEGFTGSGFAENREDLYWLNRFRVTTKVTPSAWLTFAIQAQDARVEGKNAGGTAPPFKDQFDLRVAYGELASVDKSRAALRAGRQELVFGDQRLVGSVNWLNTARSFDAVRGVFHQKLYRLDAFAASVVNMQAGRFNQSGAGSFFYGAYSQFTSAVKQGAIEPYLFVKTTRGLKTETGAPGDLTGTTLGVRFVGKIAARTDYNTEVTLQRGSLGSDAIAAWAGHWAIGRVVPSGKRSYRTFGEYNYASGDEIAGDGRRGTFDQLYPTAHDKYGLADQVGWRNIHHLRAGLEFRPHAKVLVTGGYHSFWLASATDALYNAAGAVLAKIASGAPSRHVGQELDSQLTYTVSPRLQFSGGYAHVLPGAFLKAATPGKAYNFPFVMVTTMVFGLER